MRSHARLAVPLHPRNRHTGVTNFLRPSAPALLGSPRGAAHRDGFAVPREAGLPALRRPRAQYPPPGSLLHRQRPEGHRGGVRPARARSHEGGGRRLRGLPAVHGRGLGQRGGGRQLQHPGANQSPGRVERELRPGHRDDALEALVNPTNELAFLCNLDQHWFTVRKTSTASPTVHAEAAVCGDGGWWNFNSMLPAPQPIGTTYLSAFLAQLRRSDTPSSRCAGNLPDEFGRFGGEASTAGGSPSTRPRRRTGRATGSKPPAARGTSRRTCSPSWEPAGGVPSQFPPPWRSAAASPASPAGNRERGRGRGASAAIAASLGGGACAEGWGEGYRRGSRRMVVDWTTAPRSLEQSPRAWSLRREHPRLDHRNPNPSRPIGRSPRARPERGYRARVQGPRRRRAPARVSRNGRGWGVERGWLARRVSFRATLAHPPFPRRRLTDRGATRGSAGLGIRRRCRSSRGDSARSSLIVAARVQRYNSGSICARKRMWTRSSSKKK